MAAWLAKLLGREAARPTTPERSATAPPVASAPALIAEGNALLDRGQLLQAEQRYRAALAADSSSAAAAVNLGFALLELSQPQEAKSALTRALALDGKNADALFMLGRLALEQGEHTRAVEHLSCLVQNHRSFVPAYLLLCRAHLEAGSPLHAKEAALAGLEVAPTSADLHHFLGNLQRLGDDAEAAVGSYRRAVELDAKRADSRANLGYVLVHLGRLDEARGHLLQALADRPASAEGCHLLGTAFQALGLLEPAAQAFQQALAHDADHAPSHQSLGVLHQASGRHSAALASFLRVTQLQATSTLAWTNLGTAHQELRQFDDAEACYRHAIALDPNQAGGHASLGVLAVQRGATVEALAHFDAALQLAPDHLEIRSHQLWTLCYGSTPARYAEAAREYGRRVAAAAQPFADWLVVDAQRDPQPAPLRVGLVSGDLRAHPVGYFVESVMRSLAAHGIAVHAFPTSHHDDEVTARLKRRCAGWTPLVGMFDDVAARRIRDERIHVLVDLAGHTAHHRLRVFAWRPAPVQASWLGFFASTGVGAIDYLLADESSVPDALSGQFTETIWRLPETRLCFTPPAAERDFPIGPPPALGRGFVTFGCYQNLSKVTDDVLEAWRQVLQALPSARLRLQNKQIGVKGAAAGISDRLHKAGLPVDRVVLSPPAPRAAYLASHSEIDLLLDTFPFPGGTTTCEALWMGVPTLTLAGDSMMANQGKALVSCAGLSEWVALDRSDYVRKATAFASDLPALTVLRSSLREKVLASPLFDGARFAAHLSQALFSMWKQGPRPAAPP